MRRKLDRLLRFKTEEFSLQKDNKILNRKSVALQTIKTQDKNSKQQRNKFFQKKSVNISTSFLKVGKRNIKNLFQKESYARFSQTLKSNKQNKNMGRNSLKRNKKEQAINIIDKMNFLALIKKQIKKFGQEQERTLFSLGALLQICQKLIQEIYSYAKIQNYLKSLNILIKQIGSSSLVFQGYYLSAHLFFMYGSYSLSIFYFDKALKLLGEKIKLHINQKHKQMQIYLTVAKVFLIKNQFRTAKQFGYKYLRQAWALNLLEQQLNAFDLLGKIYHECQQKNMSIYFHNRMCKGQIQDKEIVKISNYELQKSLKQKPEFAVYETIQIFIQYDKSFHQMLQDRYRMQNRNYQIQGMDPINQFYFHTNRSPNRNPNIYRILERKLIEQKKSKQLHFIKPKQTNNIRKIILQFLKLTNQLKAQFKQKNDKIEQTTTASIFSNRFQSLG